MKKLLLASFVTFAAALATWNWPLSASSITQPGGYSLIESAGTPLTVRTTLNFAGTVTCVDNSGKSRTDCTGSGGSGGGGTNTQTSNYTLVSGDSGKLVIMNCSGACTVTLLGSPSSTFFGSIVSIGSTVAGVSLNSLNWNGGATAPTLISFQPLNFWSDGTNYFGIAPPAAGTNVTLTPSASALSFAASGGGGGSGGGTSGWSGIPLTFISTTIQYAPPVGGGLTSATETTVSVGAPSTATISKMYVSINAALGVAATLQVTLENGTATPSALTCTTSSGGTSCSDTTHSVNVTAGTLLSFKLVSSGTVTAGIPSIVINYAIGTGGSTSGATITIGNFSGIGSCTTSPFIYYAEDAGLVGYCDGSSDLDYKYGPINAVPTTLAATTAFNGPTAANVPGGITMTATAGGGGNTQGRLMAVPSTPYVQIACMEAQLPFLSFPSVGMIWTDGTNTSTSKIIQFIILETTSDVFNVQVSKQTGVTGGTTGYSGVNWAAGPSLCLALQDDGTTALKYAYSYDRQNWQVVLSTGRADFLTPTNVGVYVNTGGSNSAPSSHVFSWESVSGTLF
jgi:hypothetical protein